MFPNLLFKDWLLQELSSKLVDELSMWTQENRDKLPFGDLFGDKTRLIIPLKVPGIVGSILDKLNNVGKLDLDHGTITGSTKTFRLGKFLLGKNSPLDEQEKKWLAHQSDFIQSLKIASSGKKAVIISRNPIDIARMSDHDNWTSCHSPDNSYFRCAINDAKGSGAIAYTVNKSDLHGIDLESPEIFRDKDRGIHGITPTSRLRLRRFIHKSGDYDLAIPEDRVYGNKSTSLAETVLDWAFKNQENKFAGKRPRLFEFSLVGGNYQDTSASKLFNNFFRDKLDSGTHVDYEGEDNDLIEQLEQELSDVLEMEHDQIKNIRFDAQVEAEGEPYISVWANLKIEIPKNLLTREAKKPNSVQITELRRELIQTLNFPVGDVEFLNGVVDIRIETDVFYHIDDFARWLRRDLKKMDQNFKIYQLEVYNACVKLGLAKPNIYHKVINNWDEHNYQFANFKWSGDEWGDKNNDEITVSLSRPLEFPPFPSSQAGNPSQYGYWKDVLDKLITQQLQNWGNQFIRNQKQQLMLFPGMKQKMPFNTEFNIQPKVNLSFNATNNVLVDVTFSISIFTHDKEAHNALQFVRFLDQNYTKFTKLLSQSYQTWIDKWKLQIVK